jgi:hypothetical protein
MLTFKSFISEKFLGIRPTGPVNRPPVMGSNLNTKPYVPQSNTPQRNIPVTPAAPPGKTTNPNLSVYSPQDSNSQIKGREGGYSASMSGPDGQKTVRTLDDVRTGKSQHVTLAGNPNQYGKEYNIPKIRYIPKDAENASVGPGGPSEKLRPGVPLALKNVRGVVHDTGGAFKSAPSNRLDLAVGKDYSTSQQNVQPYNHTKNTEFIEKSSKMKRM